MQPLSKPAQLARFGVFEADLVTGELRKSGVRVKLQEQPFRVLALLLTNHGQLFPRTQLRRELWSDSIFVDFDQGLATAIRKIREVLGDEAENPRFVETLPKRGYRFIAPVEWVQQERTGEGVPRVAGTLPQIESQSDSTKPSKRPITKAKREALARAWRRRLAWALGIAAALVVLTMAGLAVRNFLPTTDAPPEPLQAVPLTSYPGSEFSSSFSPDGNQVAFCWDGESADNLDIYVKIVGSETPLRLTTDPAPDFSPAWSADGRTIAFLREMPGEKAAVLLIPVIGGPERLVAEISDRAEVTAGVDFSSNLAWAPNDKGLVVGDQNSPGDPFALFLLSTESGEKRRLTSPPAKSVGDFGPAFSPDGRSLAFERRVGFLLQDIYVLALAEDLTPNGEPKRLTPQNLPSSCPTWTRDGREIVFASGSLVKSGSLWRVPVFGSGEPERLPVAGEEVDLPAISRQANRLAYTKQSNDTNIWRLPVSESGSGSAAATRLISSTRADYNPQYSPDGKRIAFGSSRTGTYGIWLTDPDGSNTAQLFLTRIFNLMFDIPTFQRLSASLFIGARAR